MGIFIRPPYIDCPKCNERKFGINGIFDYHYSRRCDNCGYPKHPEEPYITPLPKINRKIVYLDQFVISNIMKVLHPDFKRNVDKKHLDFWHNLFGKLDRISKLQLIICPHSGFHTDESLLSQFFKPLKKIYELLGHGIGFIQENNILNSQISQIANYWIKNEKEYKIVIDHSDAIRERIDGWFDQLFISLSQSYLFDFKEDIAEQKKSIHGGLEDVFRRWQTEKHKKFEDWYREETQAFGKVYLNKFAQYNSNLLRKFFLGENLSSDDFFPHNVVITWRCVESVFEKNNIPQNKIISKFMEFLLSNDIQRAPYIKIRSMLCAALARKAASGQKRIPSPGMIYDIQTISALLPYCDAMFIDNECHTFLNEYPLNTDLDFGTRLFSLNNKDKFLSYLDEIEKNMSEDHYNKVLEVYGEDFLEPYYSIFDKSE